MTTGAAQRIPNSANSKDKSLKKTASVVGQRVHSERDEEAHIPLWIMRGPVCRRISISRPRVREKRLNTRVKGKVTTWVCGWLKLQNLHGQLTGHVIPLKK